MSAHICKFLVLCGWVFIKWRKGYSVSDMRALRIHINKKYGFLVEKLNSKLNMVRNEICGVLVNVVCERV